MSETSLIQSNGGALTPADILTQVKLIHDVMTVAMRDGEHFGKIPGCGDKPTLLKPGAEKLSMLFRLAPEYRVDQTDLPEGHREYRVTCTLVHIPTGARQGEGVGVCTTMEGKYRYRTEDTGQDVPKEYWSLRDPAVLGGSQFSARKKDGKWKVFQRVEHDNPADYYNTCLKMAKKRAHTDAVLTATAASDCFTQDIEDIKGNLDSYSDGQEESGVKEEIPDVQEKKSGKSPANGSRRTFPNLKEEEESELRKSLGEFDWSMKNFMDALDIGLGIKSKEGLTSELFMKAMAIAAKDADPAKMAEEASKK